MKIKIRDLSFAYGSSRILDSLSLEIDNSQVLGLVGPNGSGKTTLIKSIDRILKPKGSILLDGKEAEAMSVQEIAKRLGYVPQSSPEPLEATVFDMVLMGRRPHMGWQVTSRDLRIVSEVLDQLHLDNLAMLEFGDLSGGQKQKVLIARALCQEPSVLLLDEPTSNLDMKHQIEVMEMITGLVRNKGISAIMALHDLNLAARFVDNLVILKGGRIYATGCPEDLLTPENIRDVYGVEAIVTECYGRPHIIPMRSI